MLLETSKLWMSEVLLLCGKAKKMPEVSRNVEKRSQRLPFYRYDREFRLLPVLVVFSVKFHVLALARIVVAVIYRRLTLTNS